MTMIKHHPNTNTLSEYAAGSLDIAASLAVAAHLHFCPHCRKHVESMQTLGGVVMENTPPVAVEDSVLSGVLARIDSGDAIEEAKTSEAKPSASLGDLPPVVAKVIGQKSTLSWKKLTSSLQIAPLKTGQGKAEVSLHKISAGGKVMEHDHRGMEYTLVLKGSFSDEDGVYQPGDFILKQPGDVHRPYAAANRDCLCLTVVEAPVRFTGLLGWLINPFLRLNPV